MTAYYNEIDPFAAQWLRNLIAAGHIAPGEVDERDIRTVSADDLVGFDQCHWFAGIAGWSLALRLAGVPDDAKVWTGSCPCQPFSSAGKRVGFADERHLWPVWFRLIAAQRPPLVLGEQSDKALAWLDLVFDDLEGAGYSCRAADLSAAGAGAPHIRQRLYFVGYSAGSRCEGTEDARADRSDARDGGRRLQPERTGAAIELVNANGARLEGWSERRDGGDERASRETGLDSELADARIERREASGVLLLAGGSLKAGAQAAGCGEAGDMDDSDRISAGRDGGAIPRAEAEAGRSLRSLAHRPWDDCEAIPCRDGFSRLTKPGLHPLAARLPGDVGILRAAGNAIVPQVAAAFIAAAMECRP